MGKKSTFDPSTILGLEFKHELLTEYFANFEYVGAGFMTGSHKYTFSSPRGYEGEVVFYNGKYSMYVDNFPGQKRYYDNSLPITKFGDFIQDCGRAGINIDWKTKDK